MNRPHFVLRARHFVPSIVALTFSNLVFAQEEPVLVITAARSAQVLTDALPDTTVIGRDVIDKSPATDVVGLLKMQAGISLTQNGTQGSLTGIRIRGGEPRHTLVLLDGMAINNLSSGLPAFEQVALSNVDRIEIVRGNVSALYGSQAVGGVIQIFSRKPKGNEVIIKAAAGSHGQRQASVQVSGGNEKVQATFGISHEQVDAISAQNDNDVRQINPYSTVNPDKDPYSNDSANGHIRFRPNENHEFGLHFVQSRGKNKYDNQWGASDTAVQYNKTRVQNIDLYANDQFTPNWKSSVKLSQYTDRSDDYDKPSFWGTGESRFQTRSQEASWQNNIFTKKGEWIIGASHTRQKLNSDVGFDATQRNTNSIWLGYNLEKGRHNLQLNARTDHLSDIGRENTASVQYGFDITPNLKAFAGFSNGFAAPNFNELYYPKYSNPNLRAEHANYAQGGVQYAQDDWGGRLNYFETHYRDKITLDSNTYLPINLNKSTARGLEWHGWYNAHGWNFESSLTVQRVKNTLTGEQLIRQPRVLASFGVGKTWGKWSAQLNWQGQAHTSDSRQTRVAGYGVLNGAVQYKPVKSVTLGLSLGNVLNRRYQTVYGYNTMPRSVLLSLQYQPQWR